MRQPRPNAVPNANELTMPARRTARPARRGRLEHLHVLDALRVGAREDVHAYPLELARDRGARVRLGRERRLPAPAREARRERARDREPLRVEREDRRRAWWRLVRRGVVDDLRRVSAREGSGEEDGRRTSRKSRPGRHLFSARKRVSEPRAAIGGGACTIAAAGAAMTSASSSSSKISSGFARGADGTADTSAGAAEVDAAAGVAATAGALSSSSSMSSAISSGFAAGAGAAAGASSSSSSIMISSGLAAAADAATSLGPAPGPALPGGPAPAPACTTRAA
jgi:hypothetical protein